MTRGSAGAELAEVIEIAEEEAEPTE